MPRRRFSRAARIAVVLGVALLVTLIALVLRPQWALDLEFARQRALAGASVTDYAVAAHRWRVLEAGRGPPLILLHGFTGMKENWLPLAATLAKTHRVIAPDLPGWGESERHSDLAYGFNEQAERLAEFIRLVSPEVPVGLVGHSMGGGIAALLVARHPELVDRLVLMDAAGVPFDNDFARRVIRGEHPFEVTDRASLRRQLNLVFKQAPFVPWPADVAFVEQRSAQVEFEKSVLRAITGTEAAAFAPGEAARAITAPTLLLWCREDRVIDVSSAARYGERIANTRSVLLDDCNHMPMMEQPEATAAALLDFLARER